MVFVSVFRNLTFVSVESGFGWLPYFLDHLDWYWQSSGADLEFPHAISRANIGAAISWRRFGMRPPPYR